MLVQAILIGLIAAFGKLDYQLGTLYAFRPIVLCPLVGIVLGDLQSGLAIGASLELLFMGSIAIGAYVPPDETIGGVLACAFAIQLGQSTEAAIALAMPIATLCRAIKNVINAGMPLLVDRADVFASKGNLKGIYAMHWVIGLVIVALAFFLCSVSFAFLEFQGHLIITVTNLGTFCDYGKNTFVISVTVGKEQWQCRRVSADMRIITKSLGNNKPVYISSDCQSDCSPRCISRTGQVSNAGQSHQQPAAHVRGLGTHGGDERS